MEKCKQNRKKFNPTNETIKDNIVDVLKSEVTEGYTN